MMKNFKIILLSGLLLSLIVSISCIPVVTQGLTVPEDQKRADLCSLLLSVGGTDAEVKKCKTSTKISEADQARLCALSAGLTVVQKERLRTNLTNLGVDIKTCDILTAVPTGEPTVVPTTVSTLDPTTTPTATTEPTVEPTSTNLPIPTSIPTADAGGGSAGGSSGSSGGGSGGTVVPTPTGQPIPTATPSTVASPNTSLNGQVGG